jgi:hypothetical protein
MLKTLFFACGLLFANVSQACTGYQSEDYVLLEKLPPAANEQILVAKVKLLVDKGRSGTVRVIEAIKGVVVGQEFDVEVAPWSCSYLEGRVRLMDGVKKEPVSDIYFLAGDWKQLKDKRVFVGGWRDGKKIAHEKLD